MTTKRDLRRAVREAEGELARALPPHLCGWLGRAVRRVEGAENPGILLAGALAGIGIELERAYQSSGSRVRDQIFYLHGFLNPARGSAPNPPLAAGSFPALEVSLRRFELFLKLNPASAAEARRAAHGWIEVAAQRLTMDRYPRADERVRHARALIVAPSKAAGVAIPESDAEWLLRLWDLLGAEEAARGGQNLVTAAAGGMGGFYAIADAGKLASEADTAQALEALRADGRRIGERLGRDEPYQSELFGLILKDIDERIASGLWPAGIARGTIPPAPRPNLWRRIFG